MGLTEELRAAVGEPPPPNFDVDRLIAGERRRGRRVRVLGAVAATIVAVIVVTVSVMVVRGATHNSGRPIAAATPVRTNDPVVIARLDAMLARLGGPLGVPSGTRFSYEAGSPSGRSPVGHSPNTWDYSAKWTTPPGFFAGYVLVGPAVPTSARLTCANLPHPPGYQIPCEEAAGHRIDLGNGKTMTADGIQFLGTLGPMGSLQTLVAYRPDGTQVIIGRDVPTGQALDWTPLWAVATDPSTTVHE
jgi:hypothetical protein